MKEVVFFAGEVLILAWCNKLRVERRMSIAVIRIAHCF